MYGKARRNYVRRPHAVRGRVSAAVRRSTPDDSVVFKSSSSAEIPRFARPPDDKAKIVHSFADRNASTHSGERFMSMTILTDGLTAIRLLRNARPRTTAPPECRLAPGT